MKSKLLLITAFLFFQGQFLFSQCISIELSITWEMGHHIFEKDSILNIPKLNITYRNNCDTNYYFFNVSGKDNKDMVQCFAMINYDTFDLLEIAKSHWNYTYENFNVKIGERPRYNEGWKIDNGSKKLFNDPNFNEQAFLRNSSVNCDVNEIYIYLYSESNEYKPPKKNHKYFEPSILTPENIISGSVQDQFIFLKPNETHVETYNLFAFQVVEGCFTFLIDQKEIKNYVLTFDGKNTHEFELPEIVGEYLRYSGAFNTNKVTVCFGEQ